jgi:hypothetical protein
VHIPAKLISRSGGKVALDPLQALLGHQRECGRLNRLVEGEALVQHPLHVLAEGVRALAVEAHQSPDAVLVGQVHLHLLKALALGDDVGVRRGKTRKRS